MEEKTVLDLLYEACRPFDEGEIAKTAKYRRLAVFLADAEGKMYSQLDPGVLDFDDYQNATSCETECERRHYFAEGFRMGYEAAQGKIHSMLEELRI